MIQSDSKALNTADREIVTTRVLNAPRELVFKVWTDPQHVMHWWGPTGFTTTIEQMQVKPGGVWRFVMHGPDGVDYLNRVVFIEVERPERLVYVHGGEEGEPGEFHVTVTFAALGNKTSLTMRALFESAAERDKVIREHGAIDGAKQTIDRLEAYLAGI